MLPKRIIILDTETISINKPYIYDLGFILAQLNEETQQYEPFITSQQIIQQIYDNKALFTTAYYEKKRLTYTSLMKGRTAKKTKYGFALRYLFNVMQEYEVDYISAYNSPFDKRALKFTSEFFKLENDFQTNKWLDIHGIANNFIHLHKDYLDFATKNGCFGVSGYLQTNAEITYAYLLDDPTYKEPHTSLQDCFIEMDILNYCIEKGFKNEIDYPKQFIAVDKKQALILNYKDKEYIFPYLKRINHKNGKITLK